MSERVLWFMFGDIAYWSFTIDDEELLAGTLSSGPNLEIAFHIFEVWLDFFLEFNAPDIIGVGLETPMHESKRDLAEGWYALTEMQAKKYKIRTFDIDICESDSIAKNKRKKPRGLDPLQ